MNISHYIELSIPPGFFRAEHKKPPIVRWFELTIRLFHAINCRNEWSFPIALPDYKAGHFSMLGKRLRVFGEEKKLENLIEKLKEHDSYFENMDISKIKKTPDAENWFVYTSCVFPKRNKNSPENYHRKVKDFESFPQIKLQSQSNKNWYVLGIQKHQVSKKESENKEGKVNSYGFSLKNEPVALPDF